MSTSAWGDGLATVTDGGQVLDVWFPAPALGRRPCDATPPPAFDPHALAYTTPSGAATLADCMLRAAYESDNSFRGTAPSSPAAGSGYADLTPG